MKQLLKTGAFIAVLLICVCVGRAALGQGTSSISGTVVDAKTHQPVVGVRVDVFADSSATNSKTLAASMSRKDGTFLLEGLNGGQYRVSLSKMGYAVEELTGLSVKSKERTIIGVPIALHGASEEYASKMACNRLIRPDSTADVYVVCAGR